MLNACIYYNRFDLIIILHGGSSVDEESHYLYRGTTMATYQVNPPEPFTFSRPEEWPRWYRQYERFSTASGLDSKDDKMRVNTLVYTMGDEAEDILRSFSMTEEEHSKFDKVQEKFEDHFVKRRNVIYERAKFNKRKQEQGEPVDKFITALYSLAEHCGYGVLHDEMIRDRIVVGITNPGLSEKLQLDADLTLGKAVIQVRQAETVKQQQSLVREDSSRSVGPVGQVRGKNEKPQHKKQSHADARFCTRCGKVPPHDFQHCPARRAICRKCQKQGHYQAVCRSGHSKRVQQVTDGTSFFLGVIGNKASKDWEIELTLNGTPASELSH